MNFERHLNTAMLVLIALNIVLGITSGNIPSICGWGSAFIAHVRLGFRLSR